MRKRTPPGGSSPDLHFQGHAQVERGPAFRSPTAMTTRERVAQPYASSGPDLLISL
jgi:hypothetical protein